MRVRGYVVLDSKTWGRLCAILMGSIAVTIVLIVANKASLRTTSGQGTKLVHHMLDGFPKGSSPSSWTKDGVVDWAVVPQAQIISEKENSNRGAGYTQQLAQLAHQVSLLETRLHKTKAQQQQQHGEYSKKVCIVILMRTCS